MVKPNLAPKTQTAGFMIFSSLMLLILSAVVLGLFLNHLQIQEEAEMAPTRRIQDLVSLLKQAESRRDSLEKEVAELRRKAVSSENPAQAQDPELKKLYEIAGFTPVSGAGITITLQDSKEPVQNDAHADPNAGKLQAEDLLKLINELKAAGAKALAINDQRIIVTTEVVPAGQTISVNQTHLSQPVVVKAIGDPDVLYNALKIRGGVMEYLDFFNIKVTMAKKEDVTVPAYKGTFAH